VIVSEELLTDSAFGLDGYLANELGTSIGVLEETAFAVGDGTGKPLGIATTGNGVTVSQAAGQRDDVHLRGAGQLDLRAAVPVPPQRRLDLLRHGRPQPLHDGRHAEPAAVGGQRRETGPDTFLGYPIYTSPDFARGVNAKSASSATSTRRTRSAASTGSRCSGRRALLEQRPGRLPRLRAGRRPHPQRRRRDRPAELRNLNRGEDENARPVRGGQGGSK
jgi:hypothetical protein